MHRGFVAKCLKEFCQLICCLTSLIDSKKFKLEILGGISPESWFLEKSIDSNDLISPIFSGILPVKILNDKFNDCNPWRLVNSLGISPEKLFLKRSLLFTW